MDAKEPLELCNGQIWKQLESPCFTVLVLMLVHVDGELMFCKVGLCDDGPCESGFPLVMTEEDGTWRYSKDALQKNLYECNYSYAGRARVGIKGEHDALHDALDAAEAIVNLAHSFAVAHASGVLELAEATWKPLADALNARAREANDRAAKGGER